MLIKSTNTNKFKNNESCTVFEYPFATNNLSFAIAEINGRYPKTGQVANSECEEIYYCLSGSGTVHSEFGDFKLNPGDAYHFQKDEKYSVTGENIKLALINAPKWSPEQHKSIKP